MINNNGLHNFNGFKSKFISNSFLWSYFKCETKKALHR